MVYDRLAICDAHQSAQQEFSILEDDANIYKLVGPVLLKQDKPEAVMNVDKRLEFIEAEMFVHHQPTGFTQLTVGYSKRVEAQIKSFGDKQENKKMEIIKLQNDLQAAAQAAQAEE